MGYTYLAGEFPLGVPDGQRAFSAAVLGRFLKQLHSFPTQLALGCGAPHDHRNLRDLAQRQEKMRKFYADLRERMREEERLAILVLDFLTSQVEGDRQADSRRAGGMGGGERERAGDSRDGDQSA